MAKTQRRRKMSRRSNKSRSLKGGTKASSKSHIAAAAAPRESLGIRMRPGESSSDFLERLKKQVTYIASLKEPAVVKKVKPLTEEKKAIIAFQRTINARNAEDRSAAHARPHASGTAEHAAYSRAAASARGAPPQ